MTTSKSEMTSCASTSNRDSKPKTASAVDDDDKSAERRRVRVKRPATPGKDAARARSKSNERANKDKASDGQQVASKQATIVVATDTEKVEQCKPRTQFIVRPPPQIKSGATHSSGATSLVGQAKSRIYESRKSAGLGQSAKAAGIESLMNDAPGRAIPESILFGFKPPKQVNVTKAREKWELGEPFAATRTNRALNNQRATRQTRGLFSAGSWSMMTSFVATQQYQLQQALARGASASGANASAVGAPAGAAAGAHRLDASMKALARGSVLERVQQFERAPASPPSGSSGACTPTSSSSSSSGAGSPPAPGSPAALSEPASSSPFSAAFSEDNCVQQQQQQQQTKQPATLLRRRSSVASTDTAAAAQRRASIPRFYHPNGRPNTYELELIKQNIVACFDALPERRAQLAHTNPIARRQFQSIARACGFTEYFKVPLCNYVAHLIRGAKSPPQTPPAAAAAAANSKLLTKAASIEGEQQQQQQLASGKTSAASARPKPGTLRRRRTSEIGAALSAARQEPGERDYVTCEEFLDCWRHLIERAHDVESQFVHLLTLGAQRTYLLPDDFVHLIQSVIDDHAGLKFLRAAPDFHMRYIQTVIARIYFNLNRNWSGKLTLTELRRGNLLQVLALLSKLDDINQVTEYFSYEHFYVIYCKFWQLDKDHDLLLSRADLARHNDRAISSLVIERIFMGIVSQSACLARDMRQTQRMNYTDFVWFLIAEEDKKHPRAIEYWFRLMDLDGDGYISMFEMEYFYAEQQRRLAAMQIEPLPFVDTACQVLDLVNPRERNKITLHDLKRTKMATIFFDTFINLEKYLEHESREFVSTRDIVQDGQIVSDWHRYASEEYENLVTEESSV